MFLPLRRHWNGLTQGSCQQQCHHPVPLPNFVHLVAWTCKDLNKPMILSRTVGNTNLQRVSEKRKSSQSWDTFKATNSDRCNDGASIECGNRKHHDPVVPLTAGISSCRAMKYDDCLEVWRDFCFLLPTWSKGFSSESPQKQILRSGAKVRKPAGICIWAQKLSPCMAILIIRQQSTCLFICCRRWASCGRKVTHMSGRICPEG